MANNIVKRSANGIILVIESGYQTEASIANLNLQVNKEVKGLRAAKKPALILVDLSRITGHDKSAEAEATKTLRIPFDAMAIYTASRAERLMINTLILLHNSRDRVRTFKTVPEATAWLREFAKV